MRPSALAGVGAHPTKRRFSPDAAPATWPQGPRGIAAAGGGFPVRIRGAIVGVAACSGWTEEGEHALAAEASTRWRRVSALDPPTADDFLSRLLLCRSEPTYAEAVLTRTPPSTAPAHDDEAR